MTGSSQWTGGDPSFPRPSAQRWFGCPASNQYSKALDKTEDVVVALVQKGMFEFDVSGDDFDYVGVDDLVEPIHK